MEIDIETLDLAVSNSKKVEIGEDFIQGAYLYLYLTEHHYPPNCNNSQK